MNTLDKQYTDLLQDILDNGVKKETRNGGTLSVFGRQIRHKMSDGFPLLTTKKMAWKSIVTELLWFLQGRTDLRWLLEQGNTIWVGDCYANYLKKRDRFSNKDNVKEDVVINGMNGSSNRPLTQEEFINKIKIDDEFAKKWGSLGPVYGKQWRDWGSKRVSKRFYDKKIPYSKFVQEGGIDQIANLINDLKTNPDSRRLMVNAWNVGELDQMVLPPCHFSWQVYTRELSLEERELYAITKYPKLNEEPLGALVDRQSFSHDFGDSLNIPTRAISLMFNMRSCDTFLGLPFNIASYGLLLEIIAKEVNMVPDELIGNLGDVHLYSNHIEQAKEQIGREPYPLPKLLFKDHLKSFDTIIDILRVQDFILDNYQSHPSIKAPLSN